jgi:2-phospho-L-lactate transferase/gluconeogenesis factor (CofD/UPF0052 family)
VAFGGGTGLPLLLSGLRQTSGDGVSGVVTVADDGGSSGRLRQELGVAPPGGHPPVLVGIEPEGAVAPAAVIQAVERADAIVLSPGSLFTSTIPALLGAGVSGALAEFGGPVIYAANIMTQPGETVGCTLSDHLAAPRAPASRSPS